MSEHNEQAALFTWAGYKTAVCHSFEAAQRLITNYLEGSL